MRHLTAEQLGIKAGDLLQTTRGLKVKVLSTRIASSSINWIPVQTLDGNNPVGKVYGFDINPESLKTI